MGQLTLQHLREHGIVPDTSLGQHFLVDDNILGVIDRMAAIGERDVVYEPGAGVGVLTAHLAQRVRRVHAVEIDHRLEPALAAVQRVHTNVSVTWGDATSVEPATLDPVPNKLVSNLPYHVAAPIVAEALQHAPTIGTYCVMVQREVAQRLFAVTGASDYGALSVLVRALCERTATHRVSRSVFVPQPNVDSTLVAFVRRSDDAVENVPGFARFVRSCFAHRRKTLVNNLQAAGIDRERAEAALDGIGARTSVRPQQLEPLAFARLRSEVGA